jgi:hypothetical protein
LFGSDRPTAGGGIRIPRPGTAGGEAGAFVLPNVKDIADSVGKAFKTWWGKDAPVPPLVLDTTTPLPDFQAKTVANEVFSQKFGAEKIPVLGRALGGRARVNDPQTAALATWYAERHGIGPAIASAVGEEIRGRINDVFKVDAGGNLNVTRTSPGQSLKASDVFENLQRSRASYGLTIPQRIVFNNTVVPLLNRMRDLVKKYDLVDVTDDSGNLRPYFPRIVRSVPDPNVNAAAGGARVGTRQFFQKERLYETEAEGWDRGVKYETDLERRLVTGIERVYRAMADKRLATDPVFGGRTRSQLVSDLKAAYPAKTPDEIRRLADTLQSRGAVYSPAFFGRIFDSSTAALLNKEFASQTSVIRRNIATTNSFLKALQLGFDFGVGQIQLLPTLYRNPALWGFDQYTAMKAMFSRQVMAQYVRNNLEPVRELAQMGAGVGTLQEFMSGLGEKEVLGRVPVVGPVAKAFGRQFQTSLDVAKVELWKALRAATPKEQWPKVVQSIEAQLGSARMESAMVPHGRALTERVFLLAPSYYRGVVNFVGGLTERGVSGKVMREAMGAFVLGSVATYYGVGKAVGMSDEEIKERMNPANSKFMLWRVKQGGQDINIGIGGVMRSFIRLIGNVVKTSTERPGDWASLAPEKNPLVRWYRGHSGPAVSIAFDQFTGRDFLGRETGIEKVPMAVVPLTLQDVFRKKTEPRVTPVELGGDILGLQSFPNYESNEEKLRRVSGGKPVSQMSLGERMRTQRKVDQEAKLPLDDKLVAERALRHTFERQERVRQAVSPEAREFLERNNLNLPGYAPELTLGGVRMPLTADETRSYEGILVEEYDKAVRRLMKPGFDAFKETVKQARLKIALRHAHEVARLRLRRELSRPPATNSVSGRVSPR